jgi:hypothetical protein
MYLRIQIYNLQNKSTTPITLQYAGSRIFAKLFVLRVVWKVVKVYNKHFSLGTRYDDLYDLVVYDKKSDILLFGISFDEDSSSDNAIFNT